MSTIITKVSLKRANKSNINYGWENIYHTSFKNIEDTKVNSLKSKSVHRKNEKENNKIIYPQEDNYLDWEYHISILI